MPNKSALASLMKDLHKLNPGDGASIPRLPLPDLSSEKEWASLVWNIDTAEAHGVLALKGLILALFQIIQADILKSLLLDARPFDKARNCPEDLLWDPSLPLKADGSTMHGLLRPLELPQTFDLANTAVITQPRDGWRLARSLQNISPKAAWGSWKQLDNFQAIAWMPWPLVWVEGGNHSTTAAMLTHGGRIEIGCLDATELLLSVYSDGINWLRVDDDQIIAPVKSLPMAAIFEVGRRLVNAPKK